MSKLGIQIVTCEVTRAEQAAAGYEFIKTLSHSRFIEPSEGAQTQFYKK